MMWYGREDSIGYAMSFNGINWKEGKKEINGLVTGANHPLYEFGDLVLYAQIKGRYEVMLFKILPNDYIYIRTMR